MRTITITTYPSMPDRYKVLCRVPGKRDIGRDAKDAGEAAAVALNYAGLGGAYAIVGEKVAIDLIPAELRISRETAGQK